MSVKQTLPLPAISNIEAYMISKGWQKIESGNPHALIYHGPLDIYGNPLVAVLPSRADLPDAPSLVTGVLRTLSTIQAQSLLETIREIEGSSQTRLLRHTRPARQEKMAA